MTQTNATHDPELTSWLDAEPATGDAADFPIQNLPFGMYRAAGTEAERVGVRIRNQVIDVWATAEAGVLSSVEEDELLDVATQACAAPTLNALMSLDAEVVSALRRALVAALDARADVAVRERVIHHDLEDVELALPVDIGDYTDFYCSIDHARNVGSLFRPDNPLLPNYKHLPIGYHGRASSVVLSGTPVRRPRGLVKTPDATAPTYRPTARLDYELEVGFFVGAGNAVGAPIAIEDAEGQIFGYCLVNDWSARDVQAFEYQPLGPFLAKSFLTSMSPWIVTTEALAPFRVPARERAAEDPQPAPHLDTESVRSRGGLDLVLDVSLASARMRDEGVEPMRLSRGNFRHMYWTASQMLTHHASNGCNLRPGDLMASGTVSGPQDSERGCLLELTVGGKEPIELPTGETRTFLEDGDELILAGHCARDGAARLGFGTCRGVVLPAVSED